jgi:hypothetical protein
MDNPDSGSYAKTISCGVVRDGKLLKTVTAHGVMVISIASADGTNRAARVSGDIAI